MCRQYLSVSVDSVVITVQSAWSGLEPEPTATRLPPLYFREVIPARSQRIVGFHFVFPFSLFCTQSKVLRTISSIRDYNENTLPSP